MGRMRLHSVLFLSVGFTVSDCGGSQGPEADRAAQPANTLKNWGYSNLVRGDFARAAALFIDTVRYDSTLFSAENNLVIARASQGNYQRTLVQMAQTERAQLLHRAGQAAIRRGDTEIGRRLLKNAVDTHSQHFEAAAQALRTPHGAVQSP